VAKYKKKYKKKLKKIGKDIFIMGVNLRIQHADLD